MQPALRGRHLETETGRDLGDRHLFEVTQQQDLAVVIRQCLDTREQIGAQVDRISLLHLFLGDLVDRGTKTPHATLEPQTLPANNRKEPAGQSGCGTQPPYSPGQDPERLLHGVVDVAHLTMTSSIAPSVDLTGRKQFIECDGVTSLRRTNQSLSIHAAFVAHIHR